MITKQDAEYFIEIMSDEAVSHSEISRFIRCMDDKLVVTIDDERRNLANFCRQVADHLEGG